MEEQEKKATTSASPLCEECKLNASKYKCPGCSIRSCSLNCVKSHKQRTSCTGKRQQTEFGPLSQFDDNLLISDYNMLEDVKRIAESAERRRVKLCGTPNFRLPWHLKTLKSAAANRGTRIQFLSSGMSKREKNKSFYNKRKKIISWTIEWRFHPTDVVMIDHGVLENTTLSSVMENHLKPSPWNHQLKLFCEEPLESLKFFIRKYPKGQKSPYRELDKNAPIGEQLSNLSILEYPIIHVFLPSHPIDFEVIKDIIPPKNAPKESIYSNIEPSPAGVFFEEEEISDDDTSTDPPVLDLMKKVKPNKTLESGPQKELQRANSDFDFKKAETDPDEFLEKLEELEDGEIP